MSFLFIVISEDSPSAAPPTAAADPQPQAQSAAAPIYQFQAKASEDNGATGQGATAELTDSMTGEVSRVDAGRTASATSEHGRDSLERQAPHSSSALTSSRATGKPDGRVGRPSPSGPILKALSKADQIRLLRPNCKHADDLDRCGGSGRRLCRDCEVVEAAA